VALQKKEKKDKKDKKEKKEKKREAEEEPEAEAAEQPEKKKKVGGAIVSQGHVCVCPAQSYQQDSNNTVTRLMLALLPVSRS
jgi:hypothetical protein